MITEEQRTEILALKELAIKVGQKVKHLRNLDIDVSMTVNNGAVIIKRIAVLQLVTDDMLEVPVIQVEPEVAPQDEAEEIPAISTRRPNTGMAKAINTGIANAKPVDPRQSAEDVAYAQGRMAANEDQNPYNSFRNPDLHGKWTEGFIAART